MLLRGITLTCSSSFLSRTLNKQNTPTFSYSYRIDPSNYQSLNLARSYLDSYIYNSGNAYLKPQYTQSLELRHGSATKCLLRCQQTILPNRNLMLFTPGSENDPADA